MDLSLPRATVDSDLDCRAREQTNDARLVEHRVDRAVTMFMIWQRLSSLDVLQYTSVFAIWNGYWRRKRWLLEDAPRRKVEAGMLFD